MPKAFLSSIIFRLQVRWLWRCALVCACGLLSLPALAQDHIVDRAWLEDTSGQLTWDEARLQPFQRYEGLLSRGYGKSPVWIRLRIDPSAGLQTTPSLTDQLVLRIRLSYLDKVELFDPLGSSGHSDTSSAINSNPTKTYQSLNLNFLVPRGDAPRDIYLRLQSSGTRTKAIEALTLEEVLQKDRQQELFYNLYFSFLLVFSIWALLHWLNSGERVIGVFAFKQTLAILWSMSLLGYMRLYFSSVSAQFIDVVTGVAVVGFTAASAYFDYSLFREYRPPRWALRGLLGLIALLPLELALVLAGHTRMALQINMAGTLLIVSWSFAITVMARSPSSDPSSDPAPAIPKAVLVGFYGIIFVSIAATAAMLLGIIPGIELALHALQIHALLTGAMMVIFLQVRAQRLAQRQTQALTDLAVAQEHARQDKEHRERQEKTLLEIRQLAFHDSLTHLPNRRLLSEYLQITLAQNQHSGRHSALLFMDLDNFKPLNDAHGHHVGDLLLIEVGRRLESCVREADTVARFGGDEFVVLLNDLTKDEGTACAQVQQIAAKILSALCGPYLLRVQHQNSQGVVEHHCTASLGIRLFAGAGETADTLLDQADAAMYEAKKSGRNAVRLYAPPPP